MNKKYVRFIICMILSVAVVLMMSVGVLAEQADDLDGDVVDTEIGGADDEGLVEDETADDDLTAEEDPYAAYEYVCGDKVNGPAMYYDPSNGLFYLEETVNGEKVRWHSTADQEFLFEDPTIGESNQSVRSQLVIESVSRAEMATKAFTEERTSKFDCIDLEGDNLKVEKLANGLKITYTFPVVGISVPVKYTLDNGVFYATVVIDEIKDSGDHVLINVNVLPAFGCGNWEDEGYVFVPDGSGAIMNFNNGAYLDLGYRQYESLVYGQEMAIVEATKVTTTEDIRLPVFGIVKGNNAMYGIITEGDGAASITAMSGNARFGYNGASSIFHYRVMQKQRNLFNKRDVNLVAEPKFEKGDVYQVRYDTLSGESANYIGIATAYREYLKTEKGLKQQNTDPKFHLDAVGAFEQPASFLGIIPYTQTVSLTTYSQCQTILGALKEQGVNKLSLRYLGWNHNGMENKELPDEASAMGALGGSDDLAELQAYTSQNGIMFFPNVDLLTFRESGNGVSAQSGGIRTVFGKISYQPKYMLSTYVTELESENITAILTPEKIQWAAERYLASLIEENFDAVSLSNLGEYCYSNFYEDNEQYRYSFPDKVEATLKPYAGTTKLSFDGGNAYVLPYASLITNVPIHSSGYDVFDQDVPFYQAVLHGWIPYTTESIPQAGDPEVTYLAGVETGSELLYLGIYEEASVLFDTEFDHLYGSTYTLWMERAVSHYKAYMPVLEQIHDQVITQHGKVDTDVYLTGYANGVQVVVNYGDKDYIMADGQKVPAGGFITGTNAWSLTQPEIPEEIPEESPEELPEEDGTVIEEELIVTDDEEEVSVDGE